MLPTLTRIHILFLDVGQCRRRTQQWWLMASPCFQPRVLVKAAANAEAVDYTATAAAGVGANAGTSGRR